MNRELWDVSPGVQSSSPPVGRLDRDWSLLATGSAAIVLFFGSFFAVLIYW
jgi:hypothetical protein